MSLVSIADAINAQITADMDPEPPPKFRFGMAETFKQDRPPRICYVPLRERIGPAEEQGGDGIGNPRTLFTRHVGLEAHIWGDDVPKTEDLLSKLVRAMQTVLWSPAYKLISGDWTTGNGSQSDKGDVYILSMEWRVPLTRRPSKSGPITDFPLGPLTVET